jgi:hypothetical protein
MWSGSLIAAGVLICATTGHTHADPTNALAGPGSLPVPRDAAVQKALEQPIGPVTFESQPLEQALLTLGARLGVRIELLVPEMRRRPTERERAFPRQPGEWTLRELIVPLDYRVVDGTVYVIDGLQVGAGTARADSESAYEVTDLLDAWASRRRWEVLEVVRRGALGDAALPRGVTGLDHATRGLAIKAFEGFLCRDDHKLWPYELEDGLRWDGPRLLVRESPVVHSQLSSVLIGLRRATDGKPGAADAAKPQRIPVYPIDPRPTPEEAARQARIDNALDTVRPEVKFDKIPLREVLAWFAAQVGADLHVYWESLEDAGVERTWPVTMALRDVRLREALKVLLTDAGGPSVDMNFRVRGGILEIFHGWGWGYLNTEVRAYDLRELLTRAERASHAVLRKPDLNKEGKAPPQRGALAHKYGWSLDREIELLDTLQATVDPDTWADNGSCGTAAMFNGIMIVSNDRPVHRHLEAMLNALLQLYTAVPEQTPKPPRDHPRGSAQADSRHRAPMIRCAP